MKKIFLAFVFLCSICCSAQIVTRSSLDTDCDGNVTTVDADSVAKGVLGKNVTNSRVVTTGNSYAALSSLNDDLSALQDKLKHLENMGTYDYGSSNNGHEFVDFGLSVKWATCNVGAEIPEAYGLYFAWGDIVGYYDEHVFNWANYKWCNGSYDTMTKYCTLDSYGADGKVDNKTVLESTDDAAIVMWGGPWRMPTHAEQQELADNCYWEWTTDYKAKGVAGYIVYKVKADSDKGVQNNSGEYSYIDADKKETPVLSGTYSTSDTHIFLPAGGYYSNSLMKAGEECDFWSNTLYEKDNQRSYDMKRNNEKVNIGYSRRFNGQNIRAVCN